MAITVPGAAAAINLPAMILTMMLSYFGRAGYRLEAREDRAQVAPAGCGEVHTNLTDLTVSWSEMAVFVPFGGQICRFRHESVALRVKLSPSPRAIGGLIKT